MRPLLVLCCVSLTLSAHAAPPTPPGDRMLKVNSKDGTPIAYARSGKGPALVLVHGTTADHTRWAPILPALEQRYTVYAVDRRGRGASGDGKGYAIEREVEDLHAVLDAIGGPLVLVAHSYGAIVALEVARSSKHVARLVLYEPPVPAGLPIYPPGLAEQLQATIDRGEPERALVTFFET